MHYSTIQSNCCCQGRVSIGTAAHLVALLVYGQQRFELENSLSSQKLGRHLHVFAGCEHMKLFSSSYYSQSRASSHGHAPGVTAVTYVPLQSSHTLSEAVKHWRRITSVSAPSSRSM